MAKKSEKAEAAEQGESIITSTVQKTAMGEIDTMTVAPRGETTVDTGDDEDTADKVVITDKVAAREAAESGDEKTDKNLQDDVGQKPKKKFAQTRDGRIAGLTREKNEYLRELEELRGQKAKDDEEKQELRRGKMLSDHAAVEHYADALAAKMEAAERTHKDALDAGDTEKASKASKAMAELAAKQEQVKAWKSANPLPDEKAEAAEAAERSTRKTQAEEKKSVPAPHPETQRWVAENPWFDEKAADYRPEMREEAQAFANLIETRLKRLGNAAAIGSRDYFDLIDKHMAQMFPDAYGAAADDDEEDETPKPKTPAGGIPRMNGASGVAPARSSATGRQPEPETNPNKISLNQEQREVAHALILKHPNGQPYTNREKEVAYARGLKQTTQKGA